MNTLQDRGISQKRKSRQVIPLRTPRSENLDWQVGTEIVAKLVVNGVLSAAAVTALVNLFPYYLSQQAKLKEVQSEVQQISTQVNQLQEDFRYSFDPHQTRQIMQAQSGRVDPNQRQIVLTEPKEDGKGY